ncbi:VanZ family protein [Paenibacillus sp. KQZ6P-2]|uniref:VanZ family protein n=1 Tax=Paenibacillus mangrovi TaxID=2931978 RepID=A0A9X2B7H5_9BACL|nr:VanZ family protein [Paenibacillus mangrovi]MCJ8013653.1 VanZ family protein [Paenibacillus mangrovi]
METKQEIPTKLADQANIGNQTKQHKVILTITILYTILILYFMFLGFGRIGASEVVHEYTFIYIPDEFLKFPKMADFQHFTLMDLVGLGNLVAFIPFGILIPLLYRIRFVKFISLFFLSILVLETLQMLTFLGSFDINDAIQNSIGASIGYCAYKIGFRTKDVWKNLVVAGTSVVILSIAVLGLSEIIDRSFFTKIEGPDQALNELREKTGNTSMSKDLQSFIIGGEEVVPKLNVYGSEGKQIKKYTYMMGNKEIIISGHCGIPDHMDDDGAVTFSWDGNEFSLSDVCRPTENEKNQPHDFQVPLNRVHELTITVEGNEKLWDVTFKKMKYWWN